MKSFSRFLFVIAVSLGVGTAFGHQAEAAVWTTANAQAKMDALTQVVTVTTDALNFVSGPFELDSNSSVWVVSKKTSDEKELSCGEGTTFGYGNVSQVTVGLTGNLVQTYQIDGNQYTFATCLSIKKDGKYYTYKSKDVTKSLCLFSSPKVTLDCPNCLTDGYPENILAQTKVIQDLYLRVAFDVNKYCYNNNKYNITITQNGKPVYEQQANLTGLNIASYFVPGDTGCTSGQSCPVYATVTTLDSEGKVIETNKSATLSWGCLDSSCSKKWEAGNQYGTGITAAKRESCINSLKVKGGLSFTTIAGDISKKMMYVNLNTSECVDIPLKISFRGKYEKISSTPLYGPIDDWVALDKEGETLYSLEIVPKEKKVSIKVLTGEDSCSGDNNPNCLIYTEISSGDYSLSTESILTDYHKEIWNKEDQKIDSTIFSKGALMANCGGYVCGVGNNDWEIKGVDGVYNEKSIAEVLSLEQIYDQDSPCYDATTNSYIDGCYDLLAPIPGLEGTYTDGEGNERETGFTTTGDRQTVDTKTMEIGDYLNQIMRIAIGILIAGAVIMIIIAGVEYMTVESIFGKQVARGRIINALTGLLIGLAIFLILSTINPKLLEVNFSPPQIVFNGEAGDGYDYSSVPEDFPEPGPVATDGSYKPKGCPEGIVEVSNIVICKSMAGEDRLAGLLAAAKKDGYQLTGSGFRSAEQQLWLRQKNCADPENTPPKQCHPETARVGRSNHQAGLAVDFSCNGQAMRGACFNWMKENASDYGFYNLPSEPWHWSYNGK